MFLLVTAKRDREYYKHLVLESAREYGGSKPWFDLNI